MKIGVVTVTYNSSLVLEDFFSSIENQDFLDFHLYIIDNNSKDNTLSKINKWNFSTKTIFFNRLIQMSIFDKAWVISIILFLFSQLVDVQYFDGRISILFWILLAGAKNIIDEDKLSRNFIKGK